MRHVSTLSLAKATPVKMAVWEVVHKWDMAAKERGVKEYARCAYSGQRPSELG